MDFEVFMMLSFAAMLLGAAAGLGVFILLCKLRDKIAERRVRAKVG